MQMKTMMMLMMMQKSMLMAIDWMKTDDWDGDEHLYEMHYAADSH